VASREDRSPQASHAAHGGDVALRVPPGWHSRGGRASIGGLGVEKPISLRSGAGAGPSLAGMTATAGMSAAEGPELLAATYSSQPHANRRRRVPVALGALQGYRYAGLTAPGSGEPVTVFVAPTTRGVATLACRMPIASAAGRRSGAELCNRIASTLRLRRGKRFPLGPSPAFSRALRKRIGRLVDHRGLALKEMRTATTAGDQAAAAADLSVAFDKAATGLGAVRVSPESAPGKRAVVQALRSGAAAYGELADAAENEDAAAYAPAARLANEAEGALSASLHALARLGYPPTRGAS
jgi:hypothetical protein